MLMQKLLSACGGEETLFSDDVFSAYLRTGTGSDVTVTTGIDMTKGYMLWSKGRSGAADHAIYDSARGVTFDLVSNSTAAQTTQATGLKAVSSTGHTVGSLAKMNTSSATYVDFVFRKAPKFFDVVTFTAGTSSNRSITHSLGSTPGMIVIKCTNNASTWYVWHRSATSGNMLALNSDAAQTSTYYFFGTHTDATFNVNETVLFNNGWTYVAYLFAHDTAVDGIVQCGSYASGTTHVELGWEPQFVITKSATGVRDWWMFDTIRGWSNAPTNSDYRLSANLSGAELGPTGAGHPTATGFAPTPIAAGETFIYLAIRRPNKPPTTGTQVYNAIARTGTNAAATVTGVGFAPDAVIGMARSVGGATYSMFVDRLRGQSKYLKGGSNVAEATDAANSITGFEMDGFSIGNGATYSWPNQSPHTYINWAFKRAPGFFDVVCYTGTGGAQTVNHSLGVAPEMVIVKGRQFADAWTVWHSALPNTDFLLLSLDDPAANGGSTYWNNTSPTSSTFSVGSNNRTGASARPYVAYLFASLPGISKVGSYVGNGASQTIDCGFASGARFVLIKTTAATYTGGWAVGDSTRGIVAGNDPVLYLNTSAAEVTSLDWLDPHNSGFIVNETTGVYANTNGSTYIYLAIA